MPSKTNVSTFRVDLQECYIVLHCIGSVTFSVVFIVLLVSDGAA